MNCEATAAGLNIVEVRSAAKVERVSVHMQLIDADALVSSIVAERQVAVDATDGCTRRRYLVFTKQLLCDACDSGIGRQHVNEPRFVCNCYAGAEPAGPWADPGRRIVAIDPLLDLVPHGLSRHRHEVLVEHIAQQCDVPRLQCEQRMRSPPFQPVICEIEIGTCSPSPSHTLAREGGRVGRRPAPRGPRPMC